MTEQTDTLLPCPFCGAEAVARKREEPNGDLYAVVECTECYAECPIAVGWHEHMDEILPTAIAAWNTRTKEPTQ